MSYEEPTPKEDYQIPGIMARGYAWPTFCKDWEARLDALAGFEPRDDDVFVISYPKSGHHWSHEFLSMIINDKTDMPQSELDAWWIWMGWKCNLLLLLFR